MIGMTSLEQTNMDQIFQDYHDGILSGDEKLKEIYGTYHDTPLKWIECEDITIRNLLNRICDDFEGQGFDLDELPMVNIRDKFIDYEPVVRVPPEWEQLLEAKKLAESELSKLRLNESLMTINGIADVISTIERTIDSIDNKLSELT